MQNQIQLYHDRLDKVSKRFSVSPAELIALIPKDDQRKLGAIVAEIEKTEADLKPYLEKAGKGDDLPWKAHDYIRNAVKIIALCRAEAAIYLEPIYRTRRQKQAELENDQFLSQTRDVIAKFGEELSKVKKPRFSYPAWLAAYQPNLWCELTLPTKQELEKWAEQYVGQRVPDALKNLVSWELLWETKILPNAKYEVLGVPCLVWYFNTLVLVEERLKLVETEFTREFRGYKYSYSLKAGDLGSFYLQPMHWDCQNGFTIPIALLAVLAKGELEGNGIEVVERSSPFTTFAIEGFEDEIIELHDDFRKFIKDIAKEQSLAQGLLAKGLIDKDTARLVAEKAALPLPQKTGAQASAGHSTVDNSDVTSALEAMGYKKKEIQEMIGNVELSPGMSAEEKIRAVLKNMGV